MKIADPLRVLGLGLILISCSTPGAGPERKPSSFSNEEAAREFLARDIAREGETSGVQRVHAALFETYLPESLRDDSAHAATLKWSYDWSWSEIQRVKEIKLAYNLLAHLEFLLGAAGSKTYYTLFKQIDKTPRFRDLKEASGSLKDFLRAREESRGRSRVLAPRSFHQRGSLRTRSQTGREIPDSRAKGHPGGGRSRDEFPARQFRHP